MLTLFNLQWVKIFLTLMQSSILKINRIYIKKLYYAPFNYITDKACFSKCASRFALAIHKSWFPNRLYLFADPLKQFFVKTRNQNFPFVRKFVFRETIKFLFTLQAWQFACILLQKVLNCTLFSCTLIGGA